jgi:carbon monoxide dehydrogenase subunit G
MVEVTRTFTVRQPVSVVVDYLQDFARAEEWDPGTVSCTRIDPGPITVGARWANVSKIKGKSTELTYRLERLEPNRLTFVGENKSATSVDDLSFAAVDGGTSITYDADITFHGLAKVADPFLHPEFERLGDETVDQLTNVLNRLPLR